jgi:lysine-specific demethylase 8
MTLDNIERIARPSPAHLNAAYLKRGRPVILTGVFDDAPLRAIDTAPRAIERIGELPIEVQPNYMAFLRGEPRVRRTMPLGEYLRWVADNETDVLCVEYPTPSTLAAMLPRPAYCDLRDPGDVVSATFIANRGNYNHLHYDDDQRDVLLYQVFGRKRVVVIDPRSDRLDAFVVPDRAKAHAAATIPARDANGRVYLEDLDPDERDAFLQYAGAWDTVLVPGETLLMPALAWHYVEYLDTGMSVSYRLGRGRLRRLLADIAPLPDCIVQRISSALRDEAAVPLECVHLLEEAHRTTGDLRAGALESLYEALFAESSNALLYGREIHRRALERISEPGDAV